MPGVLRSGLGLLSIVFTRCFTLFRKLVGNHLRSVVRLQIVDPILFLTQQRCKADAQRSAAESDFMQREPSNRNGQRRNPHERNQRNQIRQR